MKMWPMLGVLACVGCSGDVFDASDGQKGLTPPPRLALRLLDDAGQAPDVIVVLGDGGDAGDAGNACIVTPDPSYCAGVCALPNGDVTCGNASNGQCVPAEGFYAECSGPADCGTGKVCALADVATVTGTCPPQIGTAGHGVTLSCADPSYLSIVKSSRVVCKTSSDCSVLGDGGASHACVGAAIAGYPALAGEAVGICQ